MLPYIVTNQDFPVSDTMKVVAENLFNSGIGNKNDHAFILGLGSRLDVFRLGNILLSGETNNEDYLAAFEKSKGKRDLSVLYVRPVLVAEEESSTK